MHPYSKEIFEKYIVESKGLEKEEREVLLQVLVMEKSGGNESFSILLWDESHLLSVIYQRGRVDALEELKNKMDKLPPFPKFPPTE